MTTINLQARKTFKSLYGQSPRAGWSAHAFCTHEICSRRWRRSAVEVIHSLAINKRGRQGKWAARAQP